MSKGKQPALGVRNDYLVDLGFKVRKSMGEKMEELDAKLGEIASQNILEVMTIFSIKEQKTNPSDLSPTKHNYSKRK